MAKAAGIEIMTAEELKEKYATDSEEGECEEEFSDEEHDSQEYSDEDSDEPEDEETNDEKDQGSGSKTSGMLPSALCGSQKLTSRTNQGAVRKMDVPRSVLRTNTWKRRVKLTNFWHIGPSIDPAKKGTEIKLHNLQLRDGAVTILGLKLHLVVQCDR